MFNLILGILSRYCHANSVAYVQDDIIMGTLTVRENLHFSAALRLPSYMTWKQRKERVEDIIDQLGLSKCSDTMVRLRSYSICC